MTRSHCSVFVQKRIKKYIRFCETVHTTPHKNGGFQKGSSKWILIETDVFENSVDQCECTKTDKTKTQQQQQQNTSHISRQIQR